MLSNATWSQIFFAVFINNAMVIRLSSFLEHFPCLKIFFLFDKIVFPCFLLALPSTHPQPKYYFSCAVQISKIIFPLLQQTTQYDKCYENKTKFDQLSKKDNINDDDGRHTKVR